MNEKQQNTNALRRFLRRLLHPLTLSIVLPSLIVLFAVGQISLQSYRIALIRDDVDSGRLVGMTVEEAAAALGLPERRRSASAGESVTWRVAGPFYSEYEVRLDVGADGRVAEASMQQSF